MSRNPFLEAEDEPPEPVNFFLYPEKLEQRAPAVLDEEEREPPKRKPGRPRKK